jgi:alpha-glucosidase
MRAWLDRVRAAGVSGIKVDFMNGEDLRVVRFNEALLREAARRRLLVNFHGCGKPTGERRTYPNELTREAVRGLELNRPSMREGKLPPSHNAALPFTRWVVGHADYTPFTVQADRLGPTTVAHQLATWIALDSPLQFLAEDPARLLDRPGMAALLEILRSAPAVWDETRVLPPSRIGELAVLARRRGSAWFVAVLNGRGQARELTIRPDFLDRARPADIVADKPGGPRAEFVATRRTLDPARPLDIRLAAGGGWVARVR